MRFSGQTITPQAIPYFVTKNPNNMKSVSTARAEAWVDLKKVADKLLEAGDKAGARIAIEAAQAIGRLK